MERVLILGSGQAGMQCALGLRSMGYEGGIEILGEEDRLPYGRPPLSKGVLRSETDIGKTVLRPAETYRDKGIDLLPAARAAAVDLDGKRVVLGNGDARGYGKLVIATGTRPRALQMPDELLPKAFTLRTWDDSLRLKSFLEDSRGGPPFAVIGGGFIGLEVAASARGMGVDVIVVEAQPRLMVRGVHPAISELMLARHRSEGVEVVLGAQCGGFAAEGGGIAFDLDARRVVASGVLAGIGVAANVQFLEGTPLYSDFGVETFADQSTVVPDVYAIGDVAVPTERFLASGARLESIQNANYSAKLCAAALAGKPPPKREAPWFWTDQYDCTVQMAGIYDPGLEWISRPAGGARATLVGLQGNTVRAGQCLNAVQDFAALRRAVEQEQEVDPGRLADEGASVKELLFAK